MLWNTYLESCTDITSFSPIHGNSTVRALSLILQIHVAAIMIYVLQNIKNENKLLAFNARDFLNQLPFLTPKRQILKKMNHLNFQI